MCGSSGNCTTSRLRANALRRGKATRPPKPWRRSGLPRRSPAGTKRARYAGALRSSKSEAWAKARGGMQRGESLPPCQAVLCKRCMVMTMHRAVNNTRLAGALFATFAAPIGSGKSGRGRARNGSCVVSRCGTRGGRGNVSRIPRLLFSTSQPQMALAISDYRY